MQPRYLLVLTATIQPASNVKVARRDPNIRLNDYISALRFWLAYDDSRLANILFLENSGADLSAIEAVVSDSNPLGKQVEILSVPGNDIPPGINYGYGEMEMIDHGLAQSALRNATTHMIKVTGRLRFPTLHKVLDRLPEPFDVAVECRQRGKIAMGIERVFKLPNRYDVRQVYASLRDTFTKPDSPFTSTQAMIFSHAFYDAQLRKAYHEMRVPYPTLIEHLICDRLMPFKGKPGILLRWPVNLEPEGFAGHAQKRYGSPQRTLIRQTRGLLRKTAPHIWF